jgi:hypothetical protein
MAHTLETERRQHFRDGILELLSDVTYSVLRKHGFDVSSCTPVVEAAAPATATS